MLNIDKSVPQVIEGALALLFSETNWAGPADALNESGNVCPSTSEEAKKFGAYGSLMAAAHKLYKERRFGDAAYSRTVDFICYQEGREIDLNTLDYASTVALFKNILGQ